jgi:hypothetical protein
MTDLPGHERGDNRAEILRALARKIELQEPFATRDLDPNHDQKWLDEHGDRPLGDPPPRHDHPVSKDESRGVHSGWDDLARDVTALLMGSNDTPFTGSELDVVSSALRDTQEELRKLVEITNQQSDRIKSLSEQLNHSSKRLDRKDWLIMAIGAGSALVIAGVVPSAVMIPIAKSFIHKIDHLFH